MRNEIESASNFLSNIIRLHAHCLTAAQLEQFRLAMIDHLAIHYHHHWFPDKPFKGSGYRCLRINHKMDPVIARAGRTCGIDDTELKTLFPNELTLWIDPKEVSYRIGENGSICVLYDADAIDVPSIGGQTIARATPSPPSGSLSSSASSSMSSSSLLSSPSSSPNWYNYSASPSGAQSTPKKSSVNGSGSGPGSWDTFIMDPRNINNFNHHHNVNNLQQNVNIDHHQMDSISAFVLS